MARSHESLNAGNKKVESSTLHSKTYLDGLLRVLGRCRSLPSNGGTGE